MSADLHIHILEGIEESELEGMFYNSIGSKYCPLSYIEDDTPPEKIQGLFKKDEELREKYSEQKFSATGICNRIARTPNIWVGEVSWLADSLLDGDYVPSFVQAVVEDLINRIKYAAKLKNTTRYELNNVVDIVNFLRQYRGKKIFTVSW
jgi:hypothetical protein